jgi:O-antigen/teichoic acid export membrane protein
LGAFAFLSAIYTQLNVPFLQYITGENSEVAFYTTSVRMYKIFIALFSAISGVMIPRMSVLVNENKFDQISKLVDKNFRLLFYFALPIILFTFVFAGDFISIIAGDEFVSADNPMRLAMLMLIIIGTEQIFILQILIPMRCDKEIVIAALSGVIVFVFFSFPIVSVYKSLGSVIIWMLSEFVVLLFVSYNVKKKINILFPFTFFIKALLISLPLFIIGSFIYYLVQNIFLRLIVGSVVFLVYSLILDLKFYKLGIANRLSKLVFKLSK